MGVDKVGQQRVLLAARYFVRDDLAEVDEGFFFCEVNVHGSGFLGWVGPHKAVPECMS